jgi:Ca-activated chloride channel homolog
LLRAQHLRETEKGTLKPVAFSYGHVSNPYPREYAAFETDKLILARAAIATGGSDNPSDWKIVFSPGDEKITYHEELWSRLVMAAIAAFLLDLLMRRVRFFNRKFLPPRRRRKKPGGPASSRGPRSSSVPASVRKLLGS